MHDKIFFHNFENEHRQYLKNKEILDDHEFIEYDPNNAIHIFCSYNSLIHHYTDMIFLPHKAVAAII